MYEDLTYTINGCLFTVYNTLGNIWKEEVYEKALHLELLSQGLQAERQKEFEVFYFDKRVGHYRVDLLVEDAVIVEIKAVPDVFPLHQAQLISYLKGYNKPVGILVNFGGKSLEHQTFPNKLHLKTPLRDDFDFDKIQLESKDEIKDLLLMANRILITLGAGYFHQIYRRAFYDELKQANVNRRPDSLEVSELFKVLPTQTRVDF
jgi:GxxExxY protein